MKFKVDHDLHIHSNISSCSHGEEQIPERMLRYAKENGFRKICLTDHFWDREAGRTDPWYEDQDFEHISAAKPLPQSDEVEFLFGCETELSHDLRIGVSKEKYNDFDFIIIPTTHFHFRGFTVTEQDCESLKSRADAWVRRLDYLLSSDLPFHKIGIPHLTCGMISHASGENIAVLREIPEKEMYRLFKQAAKVGVGIELNASVLDFSDNEAEAALLPYQIAKECGCKFYCGSDAHEVEHFSDVKAILERTVDRLSLTESDKFTI